ncbi:MAG: TetR/AcrR family transcriptional regulator [Rhodospirillales bacterium]|nr:TetR/AcrR family transcriptional regulator [Rhodospirillales bacterium]MBO6785886.1 TetR/AcrR family transcriptional regulator [Rhodospirillales bacterium]
MAPIEQKREQIVEAAVQEFQERGFQGASMDRISERANVSKRTVYNHFDSKEALFKAIVELIFGEITEALNVVYDPGQPLKAQLVALARAEGKLMCSERFMRLVRMAMSETIRDPGLAAEMNAKSESISVFNDFMAAAKKAGTISTNDPVDAGAQFIGLIKSRAFWPYVLNGGNVTDKEMEKIVQTSVETFLARFAAR